VRVKRGLAQSERTMDKLYADYLLASRDAPPAVRLVMTDRTADVGAKKRDSKSKPGMKK
jgi:hypothetical protein